MSITWKGTLEVKNAKGKRVGIASGPKNADNRALATVAGTYLVYRNFTDKAPHWSSDGR